MHVPIFLSDMYLFQFFALIFICMLLVFVGDIFILASLHQSPILAISSLISGPPSSFSLSGSSGFFPFLSRSPLLRLSEWIHVVKRPLASKKPLGMLRSLNMTGTEGRRAKFVFQELTHPIGGRRFTNIQQIITRGRGGGSSPYGIRN